MTEEEKKAAEQAAAAEADAAATAKLNAAIASHTKRLKSEFEKQIAELVAKLTPAPAERTVEKPAEGGSAAKADPEVVKLRETVEKLTKLHTDAEARAKSTEEKARKDAARGALREALEAKGIKGARARAVLADLEQSGALRFDEETGEPLLAIKRARTKGAKAEELAFDDLAAGIEDWSKTSDAAEFLPPTTSTAAPARRAPGQAAQPARATAANTTSRALTDAELDDQLTRSGVDLDAIVNNG